jgi:hypothetical protein
MIGADHIGKSFPYIFLKFLGGDVYRPSLRNGNSSIIACIHCRENVYGHCSIVIETTDMSQYY